MKITDLILSLPPYVSTTWNNIESLSLEGGKLFVIILKTGQRIEIPSLDPESIRQIFEAHAKSLDKDGGPEEGGIKDLPNIRNDQFTFRFPMKIEKEAFDAMKAAMSHSPEQSSAPDLPEDVLSRVAMITSIFSKDLSSENYPKAEPGCNCPHCQIARAMQKGSSGGNLLEEEPVSDEDLKFKDWEIKQTGEKLYLVINPLNQNEQYTVFLGEPLGCTCGQKKCEHLRAVLQS